MWVELGGGECLIARHFAVCCEKQSRNIISVDVHEDRTAPARSQPGTVVSGGVGQRCCHLASSDMR